MDNLNAAIKYAHDVISDNITSCKEVKLAAQRFLDDLQNPLYFYNDVEVDTVIKFINKFHLTEEAADQFFILQPWQTFIIANIYGICYKENEQRKYKQAYIELARKSGKSELITILALYHLITDVDAQIIISANSREQAKNVDFKKTKQFANQLDPRQKHLRQLFNKVVYGTSEIIVTASDSKRLDGLNSSFILIDEMHQARDNQMYNVLKSSQGSRKNSMFFIITTAGFDTESFCYQLRTFAKEVLTGEKIDNTLFSIIYTLDENDDFTDENVWVKANPNLNISLNKEWLAGEVNKAAHNPAEKSGVLVKNMNVWMKNNSIEDWIENTYVEQAMANHPKIDDPMFEGLEFFVGVDLASVSDIAAVTFMVQLDQKIYFWNRYYICEDSVSTNTNRDRYKAAAQNGELFITKGNVIDYKFILDDILKVHAKNPILYLAYDKWNSTQFIIDATESGLFCVPFSQTAGNMNIPIKEFQRLIMKNVISIEKNHITKWMIGNVVIKVNQMGNFSLDKSTKSKKIDGVSAMMTALGCYLNSPRNANVF